MIHLTKTASEMLEDFEKNGFNGIRFVELTLETHREPSEETEEEFEKRSRDYVTFIAQPDFPMDFSPIRSSKYIEEPEFNTFEFESDFEKELKKRLGMDIAIKHYPNCHEFEVTRN